MKLSVFLPALLLVAGDASFSLRAQTATPPAAAAASAPSLDFGDMKSETLTTKAWQALNAKDYTSAAGYTQKCIDMYKDEAVKMQGSLKEAASKDDASKYWALNDVGTCYFISAKALDDQGNKKGAIAAYKFLVDNLSFAQCWDPQGWYWKPADAARKRLAELQFDAAQ